MPPKTPDPSQQHRRERRRQWKAFCKQLRESAAGHVWVWARPVRSEA